MSKRYSENEIDLGEDNGAKDCLVDTYVTLGQAAKLCPNRPSTNAVWRWCRKGVKSRSGERVCLKHVRIGRGIHTTRQWLNEHFLAVAESDSDYFSQESCSPIVPKTKHHNVGQREKSIQQAEDFLNKAKI